MPRQTAADRAPIAGFSSCGEFFAGLSGCAVSKAASSIFGADNSIVVGARPSGDVEMDGDGNGNGDGNGDGDGEAAVAASVTIVVLLDRALTRCFVISRRHAANVLSPSAPAALIPLGKPKALTFQE
jgi:hypothetical protein